MNEQTEEVDVSMIFIQELLNRVERLESMLISTPHYGGCTHTFPLWMVIPPEGATVHCPICHQPRFIMGTSATW